MTIINTWNCPFEIWSNHNPISILCTNLCSHKPKTASSSPMHFRRHCHPVKCVITIQLPGTNQWHEHHLLLSIPTLWFYIGWVEMLLNQKENNIKAFSCGKYYKAEAKRERELKPDWNWEELLFVEYNRIYLSLGSSQYTHSDTSPISTSRCVDARSSLLPAITIGISFRYQKVFVLLFLLLLNLLVFGPFGDKEMCVCGLFWVFCFVIQNVIVFSRNASGKCI